MTSCRLERLVWAIFLVLITAPYLWAAGLRPGEMWGGLLWSADDQNVHLAWARQAQDGHFFIRDLFTNESLISGEKPLFWNALTWLMGTFSCFSGLAPIWFYHLFRILFAVVALCQFQKLAAVVTQDRRAQFLAFCFAALATGGGFLAPLLKNIAFVDRPDAGNFPMMPEAFVFTSAFAYPLNIASYAALAFLLRGLLQTGPIARRDFAFSAAAALFLANIHTYDALPLGLLCLIWGLWSLKNGQKAMCGLAIVVGVALAIPVAYQVVVFGHSAEFRIKALTKTPAPPFIHLFWTFSPLLWLAILGFWRHKKERAVQGLALYALLIGVLIYLPQISFARKMIEGLPLALCVLGALGTVVLLQKLAPKTQKVVAGALVLILMLSPLQFVGWCLDNAATNNAARLRFRMPPLYLEASDAAALGALKGQKGRGVVLCSEFLGSYVPRETGKTVFIGHWAETLDFERKWNEMLRFLRGQMAPDAARDWILENRIGFVILGPYERAYGAQPQNLALEPIQNWGGAEGTTLYRVR